MTNFPLHKNGNIRTADFSMLNYLQQVNVLPDKIAMFSNLKEFGLENYVKVQAAVILIQFASQVPRT